MNKKLAILAVCIAISIILGGYNSSVLFGTEYLTTKVGYEFSVGEPQDWWDCNWSYSKKIIIHHEYIESDQTDFPVLIYNSSDEDLAAYAQEDGDDILFVDKWNSTQYDHEIEYYAINPGGLPVNSKLVAWVEIPSLSSTTDTILYMYYGNPDCSSQQNIAGTWNSGYKMVQHLNELAPGVGGATHVDSTSNYNNGTPVNPDNIYQGTDENNLPQMDGLDYFIDGSGYIDFGNDNSLKPNSLTLEAWVKDPPINKTRLDQSKNYLTIVDKCQEYVSLIPNKPFNVQRTIISSNPIDVIFVALYSSGVLIQNMEIDNNSIFSGTYNAGKPRNRQESKIEHIRNKLPEQVKELGTIAYSNPFKIKDIASVKMQFQTFRWNKFLSDGRISYLVIASDGTYDVECTTHCSSFLSMWQPPSFLYDFIKFIIGENKDTSTKIKTELSDIYISSLVENVIEEQGEAQVIIKLSEEQSFIDDAAFLESLGLEKTAELESEGFIAGVVDKSAFKNIKNFDGIAGIYYDKNFNILLSESLPLINFNHTIQEFGLTGEGIRICILDTGINASLVNYSYGYDFVNNDINPHDDNGHGTQVAAIIKSMAPASELIVAKVIGGNGVGYESDVLEGLQYCIDQHPDIICFSIGSKGSCLGFCDTDFVANMCNEAVDDGIFIVAASGNDGSENLTSPACGSNVVSVGATDDNDAIASFSNVNPTLDLFAPGVDITTIAGTNSGTSMSAPHVAGSAALVLEKESLSTEELKYRLRRTGKPISYQYNGSLEIEICRLDVYNALKNIKTCEPFDYSSWWECKIEPSQEYLPLGETFTYYFNDNDTVEKWKTNAQLMVDGDEANYASTNVNHQVELCNENTCDMAGGDPIWKVEIRAKGYNSGLGLLADILLRPVFSNGDGDDHTFSTGLAGAWSQWYDITSDTNAPSPWTWDNVSNLDCDVEASISAGITVYCSKVEIRVTTNETPVFSGETPANNSFDIDWDISSINVTIEDPEGDSMAWSIETSPNIGSSSGTSVNGSRSCSVSGLKPDTTYTWYVNASDLAGSGDWTNETYYFTTKQIKLYNCSTNKTIYGSGHNVTFSAWVDACNGTKVALLIANSTTNLSGCTYTSRDSCIANSSNITITSRPQQINATMSASETTTWYAKICDNESRYRYMRENTTAWNKTYNSGGTGDDLLRSVAIDSNDDVYVAGQGYELNGSSGKDFWIMKFNGSTGERLWNFTYNGNGSGDDGAHSVTVDDSIGKVYVVGSGEDLKGSGTRLDWWLMRFDLTTGDRDANISFDGGAGADVARSVTTDTDNNAYVVGNGLNLNDTTSNDWWIKRYNNSAATFDWNKKYTGCTPATGAPVDVAYSVATDSNNKVYVAGLGTALNSSTSQYDWWIMRFDNSTGDRELNITFDGTGYNDAIYSVTTDSSNNIYFVGIGTGLNGSGTGYDWWIRRYDPGDASWDWNKTYHSSGTNDDNAYSVTTDLDSNVYVAGDTEGDWWIKRFDSSGNEDTSEWDKKFDGGDSDVARGIATDSNKNIYIVGDGANLNGTSTGTDWWIKKFEYITGDITFDSTPPTVEFIDPTPDNNTHRNDTWVYINVSSSDETQHYAFLDFNKSLLLWMPMDDITVAGEDTTVHDLSSYSNNGLAQGDASQTDNGFFGLGFHFPGTADYINISSLDNGGLGYENEEFTISLWVKTETANKPIIVDYLINTGGFPITYFGWELTTSSASSTGALRYTVGNGAAISNIDGTTSITDNNWTHVVVVDRGDSGDTNKNTTIYINGNLEVDATRGAKLTSIDRQFRIGGNYVSGIGTPALYFNGDIDEVLLFNRSLNLTEIQALYNASAHQYENNFTGLSDGWYTYTAYDPDQGGNRNETEERNFTIDTVEPSIQFVDPTPANNSYRNDSWVYVNLSSSDANQHYTFVDFNYDNILWMRMDETYTSEGGEPMVTDLSSYENNGTANGHAAQTDNGFYGKAFTFDGDGDYISLGSTNLITQYDTFTISIWAKLNATAGSYAMYSECDSGSMSGFYIYAVANTGYVWVNGLGAGGLTMSGDADMNDGEWHNIVFTKNNNDFKLYNNGNIIDSDTDTFGTPTVDNVRIGDYYEFGGHDYFNGEIDEVLAFKRALDLTEIKALYNAFDNQYEHNFTGLSDGYYLFTGYDPDRAGNRNQTEERNITIDATEPSIEFISPTLDNNTHTNNTWIYVNLSSIDANQHYTFVDFNYDNVLWMRMDDYDSEIISGVFDSSSYNNHGSFEGDASQTDNGFFGKASEFDGNGDYLKITDDGTSLDFDDQGTYTWSMWVKLNEVGSEQYLLKKESAPSMIALGYFIVVKSDNTVSLAKKNMAGAGLLYQVTTTKTLDADQWYHVAITFNTESDIKIHIDGVENVSGSGAFDDNTNTPIYMGDSTSYALNGTLDEVLIFNRALDSTEILTLYNASTYQYEHNFTSLSEGSYKFTGYDPDRAGNRNQTEERNVTIDTTEPSIEFIPPTPSNGETSDNYIHVNISSSDTNQHYTFLDFNNDLSLWMRMDDEHIGGDGLNYVSDLSSYKNNGTANGHAAQTDNGFYGKAFLFDGNGDYIRIDDGGTSLDFVSTNSYTWSVWLKFGDFPKSQQGFISKDPATAKTTGFNLCLNETGETGDIIICKYPSWECSDSLNLGLSKNTWVHAVIVYNGSSGWDIYINGVYKGTLTLSVTSDTSGDYYVGAGTYSLSPQQPDYYFNGSIDDVLIFNRALDSTEILALYNASTTQYEHNFTGLTTGNYTFTGYDPDRAGNRNQTETRWRNLSVITVLTNESTGVEEYNATLWGYLQDDGGENCTVRFEYGTTMSFGTNTSNQTKTQGDEFSSDTIEVGDPLDPGTLYYYRTYANNTRTSDTGSHLAFLTKPLIPTNFNATTYNQTAINLTWTKGQGANNTYIVRKTGSFPSDRTDGTNIYNGTGTTYNDTGLDQKTRYYYRAWSFSTCSWTDEYGHTSFLHQWSDSYANVTNATKTLRLINCSTDKSVYGDGDTVTFTAWVDADIGTTVKLLIANSTSNLDSCNYTNQDTCIPDFTSAGTPITSQPQSIAGIITSTTSNTTWYAKACDSEGRCSYTFENTTAWNKKFAFGGTDEAESITTNASDEIYVVGTETVAESNITWRIKKFNASGNTQWSIAETLDGTIKYCNDVATDTSGNVYIVGSNNGDWWLRKFDADGTEDTANWNMTIDGNGGTDIAYSVATYTNETDTYIYVVGMGTNLVNPPVSDGDWWIKKFNSTGYEYDTGEGWNKTYTGNVGIVLPQNDIAYSVAVDSNGYVYVVGYGQNLITGTSYNDWWIKKFSPDGTENTSAWNHTFHSGENGIDNAYSVDIDSNDNVYVVGKGFKLVGSNDDDWWIKKFNSTGGEDTTNWNLSFDTGGDDIAYDVTIDANNNVYVVGFGKNLNGSTSRDWWIKRFNASGVEDVWNWNISYDANTSYDDANAVVTNLNGSAIYVAGYGTGLNGSTSSDWWIKKFEYFTGGFTTLKENKEIIKMSHGTYSLEISSNGTVLHGYIDNNLINASIDTNWHYVALTFNSGTTDFKLYKDGVEVNSTTCNGPTYPIPTPNVTSGEYLTGYLDELRISSVARSSSWINTSWQNMNIPTSFATFESPEGVLKTWTYRKKITINSSLVTGPASGHSNFPVLIYNSSDSNLSANALSTGNDIIFLSSSYEWTTSTWRDKLDHEIERYDNSTGELVAWVRIPGLLGTVDTEIYMYYGNTLCTTNRENITGVWNSNYVLVQHLNESSGTLYDSTSYSNDGTNTDNNATYNSSAKIDGGYDFDGDNDTIEIPDDGTSLDFNDQGTYTWSMWVKLDEINRDHWLIKKERIQASNGQEPWGYFILVEDDNKVSIARPYAPASGDLTENQVTTTTTLQAGQFYHIAITFNTESTVKIYINGVENVSDSGAFYADYQTDVKIGDHSNDDDGNRSLKGTLDEVRIEKVVRTQGWINTSYNNVNDTAHFLTFGQQEKRNVAPTQSNPNPANGATGQSFCPTLSITVNDLNADCMNILWRTNSSGSWKQFGNISSSATNRFGYDTQGSSWSDINNTIRGSNFTCPANGTAYQIKAYIKCQGNPMPDSTNVTCAIYYKSNNSLLAATQEEKFTAGTVDPAWGTFTFSSPPSLTAGEEYYLVIWAGTSAHSSNYARLYYNDINASRGFYQSQTYNGFPDPWSPTAENKAYSIYLTYNTTCISNGTYYMDNLNFSLYETTFWWSVNLNDGTLWTNRTYSFTTQAPSYAHFYFNDYDAAEEWATNPANMVDGNTSNYSSTGDAPDVELCTANNYSSESGTITNVEIRAFGYKDGGGIGDYIRLRPVFDGVDDGDNHPFVPEPGIGKAKWSSYFDITSDTNAPDTWTWADIQNLDCDVESVLSLETTLHCSKVETRVTYYT